MQFDMELLKKSFFDKSVVINSKGKAERQVLSKFGAYTMRSAKSSLRPARRQKLSELSEDEKKAYRVRQQIAKRKGLPRPKLPQVSSAPGKPPKTHEKQSRLRRIYFAYDALSASVVVGPIGMSPTTGLATKTLERGDRTRIKTLTKSGKRRIRREISVSIKPRPFMGPAAEKNQGLLKQWRNTVK